MSKQYTLAYITTHPRMGSKLRFGNIDRTAILAKEGHDPIRYIKVSETGLDKVEVAKLALVHPDFQDEFAQTVIQNFLVKPVPVSKVVETGGESPDQLVQSQEEVTTGVEIVEPIQEEVKVKSRKPKIARPKVSEVA